MKRIHIGGWLLAAGALLVGAAWAQQEKPYDVKQDIAYGQAKGHDLLIDVFVPNGKARHNYFKPNDNGFGRGLIDVISGGWNSSRARQEEHERAAVFSILCARGYTVFAIRVGSLPDFIALDMVANLQRGVRWVKAHADEYGVDPDRLGMMGASAGGHLSLLFMLDPQPGAPNAAEPLLKYSTAVKAVGAFFPPTDFLDWDGRVASIERHEHLIFSDGIEGKSEEEVRAAMERISPARLVKGKTPPLLLIHGDSDPIVPLQQSEVMLKAMRDAGNPAELIVKEGGGHFWITIPEEVIKLADWFDQRLGESSLPGFLNGWNQSLASMVSFVPFLTGSPGGVSMRRDCRGGVLHEAFAKWPFLTPTPPKIPGNSVWYASKQPISQMPGKEIGQIEKGTHHSYRRGWPRGQYQKSGRGKCLLP